MADHSVVSRDEWIEARKALLEREKAFTRERDRLSDERRRLPWRRVERDYRFDGPDGPRRLGDLFDGRSQLIVYHFMFGPDWGEGCKSCSFLADHFEPAVVHLNQRDVSMVAVSKAPLDGLLAFRRRMGWSFPWFSSRDSGFNEDLGVSFTEAEIAGGEVEYNYRRQPFPSTEAPGASVFFRDMDGLPHLLGLPAGARHVHRRLSLAGHRAEGARRGGAGLHDELAAPARFLRDLSGPAEDARCPTLRPSATSRPRCRR